MMPLLLTSNLTPVSLPTFFHPVISRLVMFVWLVVVVPLILANTAKSQGVF